MSKAKGCCDSLFVVPLTDSLTQEGLLITLIENYIKNEGWSLMIIGNFINFIFIFAVVYGVRYFFEPKIKNQAIKKLVIDIVSTAFLALIVLLLINFFFH